MPANRASVDVRSPLALDTRALGRRPGSMRQVTRDVPAPAGWSLELATVAEGTPITLELRLESVMEGVLVSGTAALDVEAECGRCLDPLRLPIVAPVQELFAYEPTPSSPLSGGEDIPVLSGDVIDVEPVLRDAIVLALPLNPVCDDDCPGLCATCGERLADLPDDHQHDDIDPRWAALAALAGDRPTDQTAAPAEKTEES